MLHRESKKAAKKQKDKHSRPEIIDENEIKKHKVQGTNDGKQ